MSHEKEIPAGREVQFLLPWDPTFEAFLKTWAANAKLRCDKLGKPVIYPSFMLDLTTMKAFGTANPFPMSVVDPTTPTQKAGVNQLFGGVSIAAYAFQTISEIEVQNTVLGQAEAVRTPTIFKSAPCSTAAATAIWTPGAGKKFRIMGMVITSASAALAAAALTTITFLDAAAAITLAFDIWIPITPLNTTPCIPVDLKPNGYQSTAANNVLNATLTANLLTGQIRVTVWGTEE